MNSPTLWPRSHFNYNFPSPCKFPSPNFSLILRLHINNLWSSQLNYLLPNLAFKFKMMVPRITKKYYLQTINFLGYIAFNLILYALVITYYPFTHINSLQMILLFALFISINVFATFLIFYFTVLHQINTWSFSLSLFLIPKFLSSFYS